MRTTHLLMFEQITRSLRRGLDDLGVISRRMSTGKKIEKPSDDVFGTVRAMDFRLSIRANDQFRRNITDVMMKLNFSERAVSALSDTLTKLKEIALTSSDGTLGADVRESLATHVSQLKDYLLDLGNSRLGGAYVFSGQNTGAKAYDPATLDYQGNDGVNGVMIGNGTSVPVNFPGSSVFSYSLASPVAEQLGDGRFAHYTPGGGTTVNVEIRDTDNVTVLDTFSFSNVIQMTDIMQNAIQANDALRIRALLTPFESARTRALNVQSEAGLRLSLVRDQSTSLDQDNLTLKNSLSLTEDADLTQTVVEFRQYETALEAMREMSSRVISRSLMDFLK